MIGRFGYSRSILWKSLVNKDTQNRKISSSLIMDYRNNDRGSFWDERGVTKYMGLWFLWVGNFSLEMQPILTTAISYFLPLQHDIARKIEIKFCKLILMTPENNLDLPQCGTFWIIIYEHLSKLECPHKKMLIQFRQLLKFSAEKIL